MALIQKRLGIAPVVTPDKIGQFEVIADGKRSAAHGGNWLTRGFGAGYPDPDSVVELLEKRRSDDTAQERGG